MSSVPPPVYIVDDDPHVRDSIAFMLRATGRSARTFESGRALLATVPGLDPGCIMLDLRMPDQDGLAVLDQLNRAGIGWPVIIMTGHGDDEAAVRSIRAGAMDFLEKPFGEPLLTASLEQAGRRLRAPAELLD